MLKRTLIIGFVLAATAHCFSQKPAYAWNPRENHFEKNIAAEQPYLLYGNNRPLDIQGLQGKVPGTNMRNVGRALTIPGVLLMIAGAAMMSTTDTYYYSYSSSTQYGTHEEGDLVGGLGVTALAFGTAMTITGAIFWVKGDAKMKKYNKQNSEMTK